MTADPGDPGHLPDDPHATHGSTAWDGSGTPAANEPVAAGSDAVAPDAIAPDAIAPDQADPTAGAATLARMGAEIRRPDESSRTAARERQERLIKPAGSLGRLEDLSIWLSGAQGICPPRPLDRVRLVIFAGDHGIARSGVSAYPPEVTAQMVAAVESGGAAASALAAATGVTIRLVDMAVDADTPEHLRTRKVRRSSGRIDIEDALTRAEALAAFQAGADIADEEADAGADLLLTGDLGIGNTTPASVLIALLTGSDAVSVMGRGTGIDDAAWMRKCAAVRDAIRRSRPRLGDPLGLLASAGGADIAAMTGFLVQAAVRRTPVLLDGIVSGAAALVAQRIGFRAVDWWLAGHRSTEPAHAKALERLFLDPLIDYDLRLGEGTGALLAVPLLRAAQATLADMATFEEAGVAGPGD